jgi:hypothetical protein
MTLNAWNKWHIKYEVDINNVQKNVRDVLIFEKEMAFAVAR